MQAYPMLAFKLLDTTQRETLLKISQVRQALVDFGIFAPAEPKEKDYFLLAILGAAYRRVKSRTLDAKHYLTEAQIDFTKVGLISGQRPLQEDIDLSHYRKDGYDQPIATEIDMMVAVAARELPEVDCLIVDAPMQLNPKSQAYDVRPDTVLTGLCLGQQLQALIHSGDLDVTQPIRILAMTEAPNHFVQKQQLLTGLSQAALAPWALRNITIDMAGGSWDNLMSSKNLELGLSAIAGEVYTVKQRLALNQQQQYDNTKQAATLLANTQATKAIDSSTGTSLSLTVRV